LDNSRPLCAVGQRQYPSNRSLVECSKASANGGDFPSTAVKLLVDCVEVLVQVDQVAVGSDI
jgi:hypothetical protein